MLKFAGVGAVSALCLFGTGYPVVAEATHLSPPSEELRLEARHRVALAEEQRALVEELSEAACLVALDVDAEANIALMGKVRDRFDTVMAGLRAGDPELGLSEGEHYSKVIRQLDATEAEWSVYREAVSGVIDTGTVTPEAKPTLFEGDVRVLDALGRLSSRIESAYADPASVTMANALLIDLAARQEMITQAIGKDVCLVVLGWGVEKHRETLAEWLGLFEATHSALRNGMPAMGVQAAPTPEIEAALDAFKEKWAPQAVVAQSVLGGETVEAEVLRQFFRTNFGLLEDLHQIVKMYEDL